MCHNALIQLHHGWAGRAIKKVINKGCTFKDKDNFIARIDIGVKLNPWDNNLEAECNVLTDYYVYL